LTKEICMSKKLNIVILFGGASSEHDVSCMSACSVLKNINKDKYEIYKVGITKNGEWFLYNGSFDKIRDLTWTEDRTLLLPAFISPCTADRALIVFDNGNYSKIEIDCVFPVLHGQNCEDGTMQGLLKLSGIPYVGSDTLSSAVTMDKAVTKIILDKYGIKQAPWVFMNYDVYSSSEENKASFIKLAEDKLKYPMFVKPANAGSSVGISKVTDRDELITAIEKAALIDKKVVVEQGIVGREIEVSVLERRTSDGRYLISSKCGEIVPDRNFYDYDSKYITGGSQLFIPASVSDEVHSRVGELAEKIFDILGCRSLARADFFLTPDGELIFNEINIIPGFTKISMYPKLIAESGISYDELIDILIGDTLFC